MTEPHGNYSTNSIKVIPLGGLGEFGQNMMAIEMSGEIVVIDAGLIFPDKDVPNADFGVPDITYLEKNADKVKGILITHGHEDHIGALPYVISRVNVPIYSSNLTNSLISSKLKAHGLLKESKLNIIDPEIPFFLGKFGVTFFRVCHSIPDSMGIAINTELGTLIHTGDFKVDHTPQDGFPTDFSYLSNMADKGILLLMSDSTYAEMEGHSESEIVVGVALQEIIHNSKGRVLIATFASLISRVQQIIDAAFSQGKKVSVVGRSMNNNVKMSLRMGYINDPGNVLIPIRQSAKLPDNKVVIIATGSQGEPSSVMSRISKGNHQQLSVKPDDTIVLSSSPIPGNETSVSKIIDNLFRKGANVIYNRISKVHVHGHASKEELKLMLEVTKPKYFIPIHGEYRHLLAHAKISNDLSRPSKNTFVLEDGDVLEIGHDSAEVVDTVESGTIYMESRNSMNSQGTLMKERMDLMSSGVVTITATINGSANTLEGTILYDSRGFQENNENESILKSSIKMVQTALEEKWLGVLDFSEIEKNVSDLVSENIYKETEKRPVIITLLKLI
ncbi:MAG: ribonuclease J [Dehalococcoidia bacterium]